MVRRTSGLGAFREREKNLVAAPSDFLQQQHEIVDRSTVREPARPQVADELSQVPRTDMRIPRHDDQRGVDNLIY